MKTKTLMPLGLRGFLIAGAALALFASFVMIAYADVTPTVTTSIKNTSNTTITSANIGSTVFAVATVASSSATTSPTGTVTFNRYDNTSCTGTPTTQAGVALVNGVATSSNATVGASGLSYKVSYSGQSGVYNSAESACQSVTPIGSATSLTLNLSTTSVLAGSSVNANSTLAGASSNAGGSVSYIVYTNNSCTNAHVGAGVKTVTNALVPNSDSVLFSGAGSFYWRATYSGDANNSPATSSCLTLNVLATSTQAQAQISGKVYHDLDHGFDKDAGEPGVQGLLVRLYGGANKTGGVIQTDTTDGSGNYSFGNLANGTYSVELAVNPAWIQQTSDYNSVVISNQTSVADRDFAVWATTTPSGTHSISGKVFNDLDKDRFLDSGESGVSGFLVKLYKNKLWWKEAVQTTTTDGSGNYSFGNLQNGTYAIELIKRQGWKQISDDFKHVVVSGSSVSDKNFAVISKQGTSTPGSGDGSISGKVFNDLDKDRWLDSGESGIAGVTIKLYANAGWWGWKGKNNPVATATTDSNGNYSFTGLADGTYSVEQIKKSGWKQISDDFYSLQIQNGTDHTDKNFANIEKSNNGRGNDDKDKKDKHGKGDNGKHLGWFKLPWLEVSWSR